MNFSILEITRRLLAPQHELSCSWFLWRRLVRDLRERGRGKHESGAFLLGRQRLEVRRILDFVLYDDLDPTSLDTGIVRLDGRHFGKLWDLCRRRNLAVVADVHTHPCGSGQSTSDQAHPIIAQAGHIALIVPDFARPSVRREEVGIYVYQGHRRWKAIPETRRRAFFRIGI
jgi:hypothetical protein